MLSLEEELPTEGGVHKALVGTMGATYEAYWAS